MTTAQLDPTRPLYIAIDASGSMNNRDEELQNVDVPIRPTTDVTTTGAEPVPPELGQPAIQKHAQERPTRREYAIARIRDLLEHAPPNANVQIVQFGTSISTLEAFPGTNRKTTAREAIAALDLVHADEGNTAVGAMLGFLRNTVAPAQLLVILDGEPSDPELLEFQAMQLSKSTDKIDIYWLTLGEHDAISKALVSSGIGGLAQPLHDAQLGWATPASEPQTTPASDTSDVNATPSRPTQPSIPPTPNDEDLQAQREMANVELQSSLNALGEEAPPPQGENGEPSDHDAMLPPPETTDADAAQQGAPKRRGKHR